MNQCNDPIGVRRHLCDWFDQPLGRSLQAIECHRLRAVWPHLYGTVAVQLGAIGRMDLLEASSAPTRIIVDLPGAGLPAASSMVYAMPELLPFDSRSVDQVLLPHTLDYAAEPHQVLREVQRVLTPEGHIVVLGFNPLSLWGAWRLFGRRRGRVPWCGHFIRLLRIKDWLKLLDFELAYGGMLYYRPPLRNDNARDRLHVLDKIGDRWWPMGGAVYVLVAKKRVAGMTPLRPAWRERPMLGEAVARPVARGHLRLVKSREQS